MFRAYFTVLTWEKTVFYACAVAFVSCSTLAIVIEPFMDFTSTCTHKQLNYEFQNVLYRDVPCSDQRQPILFFLTVDECVFGRRILASIILGGVVGWERRQADRPAGIRTMALVSLASCLFSICSAFAFLHGPMSWDASRISAAIPSGVGFLGSALIFKSQQDSQMPSVHGLTTAASLWLSAAIGIACSGGLYFAASFSTAIMLILLRFGPRAGDEADHTHPSNPELYAAMYGSNDVGKNEEVVENNIPMLIDRGVDPESHRLISEESERDIISVDVRSKNSVRSGMGDSVKRRPHFSD